MPFVHQTVVRHQCLDQLRESCLRSTEIVILRRGCEEEGRICMITSYRRPAIGLRPPLQHGTYMYRLQCFDTAGLASRWASGL